ncbi:MAG: twin-arginine translocase subunit TatC [Chloroflexi bacterium]|nr:twin-arginine translocase subunit TatC [Chloroflexota bacterium]
MNDNPIPISSHLRELRKRITWSVIVIIISTTIAFIFHQKILETLMGPAQQFSKIPNQKPVYTELTEYIGVAMKVSLISGFSISLPFLLYQLVMFLAPGLSSKEKKYLYILLPISILAFIAGAFFGYRILFPPAINFLLNFGNDVATPYIRIGNYTSIMLSLLFWMGIVFETPIVLFFLAKIGIVTSNFLAKQRRFAIVIAFILGAIITPTFDPINQTLVVIPIILLYEIGIWTSKFAKKSSKSPDTSENSK